MKFGKRILSCFLTLAMVLSMTIGTVTSYAEEYDDAAVASDVDVTAELLERSGGRVMPEPQLLSDEEAAELDVALAQRPANTNTAIKNSTPYTYSARYFYSTFSAAEKAFYDGMDAACQAVLNSTSDYNEYVTYGGSVKHYVIAKVSFGSIGGDRAYKIFWAFRVENPQYYFLSNSSGTTSDNKWILEFFNYKEYNFNVYSTRKATQQEIDNLANSWIPEADALTNEVDKELLICNKIIQYLTYDNPALSDDDLLNFDQGLASGVLRKTTVCAGYAMLTAFMMNAAGLECVGVDSADHAWNAIKLYGNWYQLDLTWADDGSTLGMDWVNKSYSKFNSQDTGGSHVYDPIWNGVTMPPCIYDTVQPPADKSISPALFPDANFRSYVSSTLDTDHDTYLSQDEINAVTTIDVSGYGIAKLNGIELFTSLQSLDCHSNSLTTIDLSKNTALVSLDARGNSLKSIDLSKNTALTYLDVSDNSLSSLNLSSNKNINYLDCGENKLSSLNVTALTALHTLRCNGNSISNLDVSKNTLLVELECSDNKLTALGLNTLLELMYLGCNGNQLEFLNVTKNVKLQALGVEDNLLTSLDLFYNPALTSLYCNNNQLPYVDVSANNFLVTFVCSGNEYYIGGVTDSFPLSEVTGFDPTKASNWDGATYDSTTKSLVNFTKDKVTFTYNCGNTHKETFTFVTGKVKSIAMNKTPDKTSYYTGDELDVTGGSIKVTFEDGKSKLVDITKAMVTGFDTNKSGSQTLTVTYSGATTTFKVTLTALAATKIEVDSQPIKTSYYLDDALDLSGGTIKVTYNSGKTELVPMTFAGVTYSGFDSSTTGTKTVKIAYLGKTTTLSVTVSVDPAKAPVLINGQGYENLTKALAAVKSGVADITINRNMTEKALTFSKDYTLVSLSTAPGVVLTLSTPTITANCDIRLDVAVAAQKATAKTFTVKSVKDKFVVIDRLETALPVTLTGTKTTNFLISTGSVLNVTSAMNINVEISAGTTVKVDGGKFTPSALLGEGKLDVYNAATVTLADVTNADIILNKYEKAAGKTTTVNLQKLTVGSVTKLRLTVKEPDGTLSNISGQTVITLSKQDAIPAIESRITIVNTANGKVLSAVQYAKEVRAEYLDALTVSDGSTSKNYSSFEKAFESMTNTAADYTIKLNEDTSVSKFNLPKVINSLCINGQGHALTLIGVTSINPKYAVAIFDVNITGITKTGTAAALTLGSSGSAFSAFDLLFTGTSLTINSTKDDTILGDITVTGKTFTIKGGNANTLTLFGSCSEITSLTGFAKDVLSGTVKIGTTFTANDVELSSAANLTIGSGATFTVNKNKAVTGDAGATITLIKGFKPIVLNGSIAGNIKFASDVTLEDQQIFKTKEDLSGKYDLSGISPNNGLTYDLIVSGGIAYLKAYTLDLNGVKYAFWNDAVAAMTDRNTDYTLTLLADFEIGAAFKLPTAAKCKSLTINGNGHKLTFVGTSVSLTAPTTFKNITINALKLNSKTKVYEVTKWTLRNSSKLTEVGTVVLTNCDKK